MCTRDHTQLDHRLTGHQLHCPKCQAHLTSLLLCPSCGLRIEQERAEFKPCGNVSFKQVIWGAFLRGWWG